MAMGVSLQVGNTVGALWGRSKNTGKSEADAALIERFRGVLCGGTSSLHAVRERKPLRSRARTKQRRSATRRKPRKEAIAAHWPLLR